MKTRKIAALLIVAVFLFAFVAACGSDDSPPVTTDPTAPIVEDPGTPNTSDPTPPPPPVADEDLVELIWQWPNPGNIGPGFQDVEDAFNEMLREIGVKVHLEPVGLIEAQADAMRRVAAGEQIDIMLTAFSPIGPLVDAGLILPLDDLIDTYGRDIKEQAGPGLMGSYYAGSLYGLPPVFKNSEAYGYAMRKDIIDKYGITIDLNKVYTLDDLEEIFAIVKEGEGDNFYMTIPWNSEPPPLNGALQPYDRLAGNFAGGVLMLNRSFSDLTIHNFFATEEYADYAQRMYNWAQRGYLSPDAAITSEFPDTLLRGGNYLGMFYWADPSSMFEIDTKGFEFYLVSTVPAFVPHDGGNAVDWNIPVTSVNPAKAVEAVNYIYKNHAATWLIQFGLEGVTHEVLQRGADGRPVLIKYLADDPDTLPYFQPYGLYGNRLEWPAMDPSPVELNQMFKDFENAIPASRNSPALGYSFVATDVAAEIAAVNAVIEQYTPSFNGGAVNPSSMLPEFIRALEGAGIDRIIAENQRQLDAWAASR